jgi:hypothetical protein
MPKRYKFEGLSFGRLTVLERVENDSKRNSRWLCSCVCGNRVVVRGYTLKTGPPRSGVSQSCGCLQKTLASARGKILIHPIKHGHNRGRKRSPTAISFNNMHNRCDTPSPTAPSYFGVQVCERWSGPNGFTNFLLDIGERPSKDHSLGRFLDTGHYEPTNCAWQTRKEQTAERRGKQAMLLYRASRLARAA